MRVYESLIIFDSEVEDAGVQDQVEHLLGIIESAGGRRRDVDYWGKRDLAYEIKDRQGRRHKAGTYVCVTVDADHEVVDEVNRQLSLSDSVLRFKTLRLPDKVFPTLEPS